MIYTIYNQYLTVNVNDMGATLWNIIDNNNQEYLWQGDPLYWVNRAPNLFPYIGRMSEGKYTLQGKKYEMGIHGFARNTVFKAEQISDSHIVFSMESTEETYKQYPYHFLFSVIYKLEGNKISTTYYVRNDDDKTMYFGVGGHPGFHVPFETNTVFEDYYLEFDTFTNAKRICFSDACLVSGEVINYPLEDGVRLPLTHDLFDHDAIVLTDVPQAVTLTSKKTDKGIRVTYPNLKYLGVWHMPKTDAPYVCIEPWSSLPSRQGVLEDLETQPDLLQLKSGCEHETVITIELQGI